MAEIARLASSLLQEPAGDRLAADHVGLEFVERHPVQVAVRVAVVPQLEPGVQPHPEERRAAFDLARASVAGEQLSLVDETHGGNAVLAHRFQQPLRELFQARQIVGDCRHRGQVVEGHRDGPLGRAGLSSREDARRQYRCRDWA